MTSFSNFVDSGLNNPYGLAFQGSTLYVANFSGNTISTVDPSGVITPFAINLPLNGPVGLAFDASQNLYVANYYGNSIYKIVNGVASVFCNTLLNGPHCITFGPDGNLFVSNNTANNIIAIDTAGTPSVLPMTGDSLSGPCGIAFSENYSNLYVANFTGDSISRILPNGTTSNINNGLLNSPIGITFDNYGNLYIANNVGFNILKLNTGTDGFTIVSSLSNAPRIPLFSSTNYLYVSAWSTSIYRSNDAICFNEGTKILCLNAELKEEYIPIELLKKGDLVKSYLHGYRKIDVIGKGNVINNPLDKHQSMYKMEKTETNGLLEDLIVTGYHSILVDQLSKEEQAEQKKINFAQSFDNKQLLLACVSKEFEQLQDNNEYHYYHFILENDGDDEKRFGVYANGVLCETPSKTLFLKKHSQHNISLV